MTSSAKEEWREIPGYEGRYEASSLGRIRSVDAVIDCTYSRTGTTFRKRVKGRVKTPTTANNGYFVVNLGHNDLHLVHELVAATFIGPRPDGHEICHGDGNPKNNAAANLRYDTPSENSRDKLRYGGTMRKLTEADVRRIRSEAAGRPKSDIAREFGISPTMVGYIAAGRCFGWLT